MKPLDRIRKDIPLEELVVAIEFAYTQIRQTPLSYCFMETRVPTPEIPCPACMLGWTQYYLQRLGVSLPENGKAAFVHIARNCGFPSEGQFYVWCSEATENTAFHTSPFAAARCLGHLRRELLVHPDSKMLDFQRLNELRDKLESADEKTASTQPARHPYYGDDR